MTLIPRTLQEKRQEVLRGYKEILNIDYKENGKVELNWPMKVLIAIK